MKEFTPKQIVEELDKYIIGQKDAKKAVAIALRNRYRRKLLSDEFREEVKPKNILMVGPTGVGKTEIARRLSKLVKIPFIKVEATKFTEVGYVGRDVDAMIRDLVEESIRIIKVKKIEEIYEKSKELANNRIIDIMAPFPTKKKNSNPLEAIFGNIEDEKDNKDIMDRETIANRRDELRKKLLKGELEEEFIDIQIEDKHSPTVGLFSGLGMEEYNIDMGDIFGDLLPKKTKKRKVTVKEARKIITDQEAQKLLDMDEVINIGIKEAEESGIIFIDEIDKIAGKDYSGPNVSREGVQRDILPIVEGTTVMTKYGPVKTDHILFIAAGAFHVSKVEDLIPEMQGRFPNRVELENLTEKNFVEILTKPQNAIIKQHKLLLETEGIKIRFTKDAIEEIANIAYLSNEQGENIGARRLQTVLEKVLEEISFEAPYLETKEIVIDGDYVKNKFVNHIYQKDILNYIL